MESTKYPSIDINKIAFVSNITYEMKYNYESINLCFSTRISRAINVNITYKHIYERMDNGYKIYNIIIVHLNEYPDDICIIGKDADESLKYISKIRDYCGEYFDTNLISNKLTPNSHKDGMKIINKIVDCINKIISFAAPL